MIFFSALCSRPRSRAFSLLCTKKGKGPERGCSVPHLKTEFPKVLHGIGQRSLSYFLLIFCVLISACISNPLGMEDGSITDNMITASSTHANGKASWGRLHYSLGSWTSRVDSGYQWFQVNFVPEVKQITHIATQGNGRFWWWVMRYYVMHKAEGAALQEYKENDQRVVSGGITSFFILKWQHSKPSSPYFRTK